jgi:hypothetical protein
MQPHTELLATWESHDQPDRLLYTDVELPGRFANPAGRNEKRPQYELQPLFVRSPNQ